MFVAERATPFRVGLVRLASNGSFMSYEALFDRFLAQADNSTVSRPVDVQQAPDGALLMSDDSSGAILRFVRA